MITVDLVFLIQRWKSCCQTILNNDNGINSGHVHYDWNGSSWEKVGDDIDGENMGDYSGYSVSLSSDGSRIAIGARYNDGNGTFSGHVRIYDWNGSSWTKVGDDIDGENINDQSGSSVSLSSDGSRVAIGASFNDGDTGHVRIYGIKVPDGYSIINGNIIGSNVKLVFFTGNVSEEKH